MGNGVEGEVEDIVARRVGRERLRRRRRRWEEGWRGKGKGKGGGRIVCFRGFVVGRVGERRWAEVYDDETLMRVIVLRGGGGGGRSLFTSMVDSGIGRHGFQD